MHGAGDLAERVERQSQFGRNVLVAAMAPVKAKKRLKIVMLVSVAPFVSAVPFVSVPILGYKVRLLSTVFGWRVLTERSDRASTKARREAG